MELADVLQQAAARRGPLVVLTGAGVSAESGIPTFRGPEGYWTVGSRHYQAEEMATAAMFRRAPENVWGWYLYRRGVCLAAAPNPGHLALVQLEAALGERFVLVTQNVDGLHLRAGNTGARTLQVHGNLHWMRCARECTPELRPLPAEWVSHPSGTPLAPAEAGRLRCAQCGGWMRPHVLWFDETYDEPRYRFETALAAAERAALLVVVGTSGSTTLPQLLAGTVVRRGAPLVDVDPGPNPFATLAAASPAGCFLRGTAAAVLPELVRHCIETFSRTAE
jgi:NAD-dependent deacetylase